MKFSLILAAAQAAYAATTGNAAIDKILEMLGEMETTGKKDKQEESVAFAAFKTWCDNTQAEKTADIKASSDAITQFQAEIEQAQAQAAEAQDDIDEATAKIDATTEDLAAMKKVRNEENSVFITEKTDLNDSIYASEKAIEALSAVPEKAEATSFLQQLSKQKTVSTRMQNIQSLLETVQAAENPFTSATERKSNTVIDMLDKLKEEFSQELQQKTKDESDKKHSYEMAVQEGQQTIASNKKLRKEKEDTKAEAEAAEGSAKKDLDTEEQSKADDTKYLREITSDCALKTKDFAARQKSRSDELTAIAEAVSILKSPEVQKGSGHLDSAQSVGSFIQLTSRGAELNAAQEKVISFLRQRGSKIHSNTLMQLAELAGADPFVKIRKMVQELITRLEEEAKAELTKKGKCDKDMAENKAKIEEFTTLVEKLTAEIEILESEVAEGKATKKRLTTELAELKKNVASAKKMRLGEKTENEKVISESKAALDALDQAMSVLQNYYSKVKGAFIQQPEFSAGKYEGMGGGGVLGLLEVVKSQTDQLIRETTQSESDSATAHDEFITTSEMSEKKKTTLLRSTEETLAQKKEDLSDKKDALEGEDGAKAQLAQYVKEKNEVINPQCTVQGVSFEERNAKREEEIQSLSEALEILGQMAA